MQSLRQAIPGSRTVPQKEEEATPGHVTACARQNGVRHTVRIVAGRARGRKGKSAFRASRVPATGVPWRRMQVQSLWLDNSAFFCIIVSEVASSGGAKHGGGRTEAEAEASQDGASARRWPTAGLSAGLENPRPLHPRSQGVPHRRPVFPRRAAVPAIVSGSRADDQRPR